MTKGSDMFDKLFDFIENHKIAFVAVTTVLFGAVYMTATAAMKPKHEEPPVQEQVVSEQEGSAGEESAAAGMTDEQRRAVGAYDAQDQALVEQLAAASWIGADGKGSIEFKADGTYEAVQPGEGDGAVEKVHGTYALVTAPLPNPLEPQDGSLSTRMSCVLLDDGSHHLLSLDSAVNPDSDSPSPVLTLTSTAWPAGEYTTRYAAEKVEVTGFNDEVSDAVDGHIKGLKKAVAEYVRAYHPSCHTATWDKTVSVNYDTGFVSFGVNLDSYVLEQDGTPRVEFMEITYDMQNGTFEGNEA